MVVSSTTVDELTMRALMVIVATKGPGHKLYQCTQQPAAGSLQQAMASKHANAKQPSLTGLT